MNQHYVPKLILDGFVNPEEPGNRGVWVYRRSTRRWRKRPTRRVVSVEDLYNFTSPDEPRDDTIEQSMSNIESTFAAVLREAIIPKRAMAPPRPFDVVVTFCSLLMCRNPSTGDKMGEIMVRDAKAHFASVIASEQAFQAFRTEMRDRAGIDFPNIVPADRHRLLTDFAINPTKFGSLGVALLGMQIFPEQLAQMAVSFYHTSSSDPFITADRPYAIVNVAETTEIEQLLVPLSATVAAVFDAGEAPVYRHRDATHANVLQANAALLSAAEDILISYAPDVIAPELLNSWTLAVSSEELALIARQLGA